MGYGMIEPNSLILTTVAVCFGISVFVMVKASEKEWDKLPFFIFGVPVTCMVLSVIPVLTITVLSKEIIVYETVIATGGCNREGICGAITESGYHMSKMPVVGLRIPTKQYRVWKYESLW